MKVKFGTFIYFKSYGQLEIMDLNLIIKFLLAILPIVWLIIALSRLKMPSHTACLIALGITAVLAFFMWKLAIVDTATAALYGIKGSPTKVKKTYTPVTIKDGVKLKGITILVKISFITVK